ncbi:MAG TPA: ABC transporter ATP-binding protein [Tepidisphaeraceae bacterium]|jgi:iron(III) transport system ATP-binding protein|nr:ABC transporter ATP-binding protein [Tepidisphaeraceae bacterium]
MTSVHLDHIFKRFGATVALNDINLKINAGELFFLLGPSGCGKSTLLRLIAGLHEPSEGRIYFNDRDVTNLPTEQRNAVMCFQSYALWPHMSVRENVRFGLDVRALERTQREKRVDEVLALVQMEKFADRKPNQLSGGQQQRVALARALAVNPDCLLLDEPLSNLDAQLRLEMRSEIRRICKTGGFTTIYVTHDQKEALSVADRIAVLKDGKLAQMGTPGELYHRPNSAFVASFMGQTNLLSGKVIERHATTVRVETAVGKFVASSNVGVPDRVTISIRPEQMQIVRGDMIHHGRNRLTGQPTEMTFLGEASEHVLKVKDQTLKVISAPPLFDVPAELTVEFDPEDVVVLAE